jgi:hypothetical protein
MFFPVVVGAGKRLFADGADQHGFRLVETRQPGDVVILVLRRPES